MANADRLLSLMDKSKEHENSRHQLHRDGVALETAIIDELVRLREEGTVIYVNGVEIIIVSPEESYRNMLEELGA
jgi:hypothetical protein